MTRDQVAKARDDGYEAGYDLAGAQTNPHTPDHVPAWRQPRTRDERDKLATKQRPALILSRIWRTAYRRGMAQYGRDNDKPWLVELAESDH